MLSRGIAYTVWHKCYHWTVLETLAHNSKFSVVILNWLPIKTREPSLPLPFCRLSNIFCLFCICAMYVFTYPSAQTGCSTRSIFKSLMGLNSVFLLLDWLPYHGWRAQSTLLYTHDWKDNSWILTLSQRYRSYVKGKWSCSGFELTLLCLFPTPLIITP